MGLKKNPKQSGSLCFDFFLVLVSYNQLVRYRTEVDSVSELNDKKIKS